MAKTVVKKPKNSRQKGAAAEREFAAVLKTRGFTARRGQQFSGGGDSPDVVCDDLTGVHLEIKRVEASKVPYDWLDQAIRDAKTKPLPIVFHRRNGKPWIAICRAEDMLDLLAIREGNYL